MMRFRYGCRVAARDIFMLVIGVLIGLCILQSMEIARCSNISLSQFKQPRVDHDDITKSLTTLNISKPTTQAPNIRKNPHEIDKNLKRPKYLKDELVIRKPLYIGVVTASEFLNTRAMGVNSTWGHKATKVEYYAAEGQGTHPLPVVSLEGVDDTYPPQKKVYRMLQYMHDHYIDQFNWFFRADDDVYIRIPQLLDLLSTLDPLEPLYIGSPGLGKPEDLERIKLYPHERYCMGGPGVVFSRALLIQLVPHLDDCLQNVVVSWNEDLEVGRCISRRLGVQCTWAYEMRNFFYMDYSKGAMFKDPKVYRDKTLNTALTVHPFKTSEMMYRIHQFFLELAVRNNEKEGQSIQKELEIIQKKTKRTKAFP